MGISLFFIGRLLFGGYFLWAGIKHFMNLDSYTKYAASKHVPYAKWAVIVSGILAGLGGLWVVTGWYVSIGLWEIVAFLIPVSVFMHDFWKEKDAMARMQQMIQFQKNMAMLGATLIMLSTWTGGGY